MYNSRIALMSRAIRPAIQRPHALVHTRMVATFGPRAASDPPRPATNPEGQHHKNGRNNALYVGGGLVGLGAIWYYYAMAESARITKEQEKAPVGAERGRGWSVDDTKRSEKERIQELLKSGDAKYQDVKAEAQSKVQAGKDQVGQSFERGKQRFEEGVDQAARRASEAQYTAGKQSLMQVDSPRAH
jgi:hypothetical protein